VDRLTKAATAYGSKWDKTVALKVAATLAEQPGYAEIALAQARRAERMLADTDSATVRLQVLDILARTLVADKKTDEVKPVMTQIARVEARDFADYAKTSSTFAVEPYKGRKAKSDRIALVEVFSGSEFPYSLPFEQAAAGILKTYPPTDVAVVCYHVHLPSPDPLTCDDSMNRIGVYQKEVQNGFFSFVNGKPGPRAGQALTAKDAYTAIRKDVDESLEKPAAAKLTLTAAKGAKGFDVKAGVSGLTVGDKDKFVLRFVVIEPRVRYAGESGARYHVDVVRAMPGGAKGFALTKKMPSEQTVIVKPDDLRTELVKYLTDFATKAEFTNLARPLDLKNLKVVAFVQNDATGEVLNAAQVDLEPAK
jgi:hypothetical protein